MPENDTLPQTIIPEWLVNLVGRLAIERESLAQQLAAQPKSEPNEPGE